MNFYLIAITATLLFTGLGFFLGWDHGRTQFAHKCITIGNCMVHDVHQDKRRRFACREAEIEQAPPAELQWRNV